MLKINAEDHAFNVARETLAYALFTLPEVSTVDHLLKLLENMITTKVEQILSRTK